MKTVPIHELKRNLASLVDEAAHGERILITRHNRPVASLVPPPHEGLHVGDLFGLEWPEPLADATGTSHLAATLRADRAEDR